MFLNIVLLLLLLLVLLILYLLYFKKNEVYYIKNFLTDEEYNYIRNYTRSIKNLKSEKFRLIKPILDEKIIGVYFQELVRWFLDLFLFIFVWSWFENINEKFLFIYCN